MGRGTEFLSDSGRHHGDGAQAWTPQVPAQTPPGSRGAHESRPGMPPRGVVNRQSRQAPQAPAGNTDGHLAGELPAIPAPRQQRGARRAGRGDYPASRGELPLPAPPESEPEHAPRRTRISFSELEPAAGDTGEQTEQADPAGHTEDTESPDAGAAEQEPPNGLGMFDLGSVPASVTPPSTWRRAAWFAAASSGGVMGLLFAGTFLLGQQPAQPQAVEQWSYLNRRGGSPMFDRDELLNRTSQVPAPGRTTVTGTSVRQAPPQATTTSRESSRDSSRASSTASRDDAGMRPGQPASRTEGQTSPTSQATGGSSTQPTTSRSATPTTTPIPQKPPPTTPESDVVNPDRGFAPSRTDWREMAAVSNDYLNTVTENPEQARQYTTGELYAKGADGLRRQYAKVAYFEVRKITVNEGKAITINTVNVVYKDGHAEIQKRTLAFSDNGKISNASR